MNEKKRWAEYLAEKKMLDANEKYIKQISSETSGGEKKEKTDLLLDEAVKIFIRLYLSHRQFKNSTKQEKISYLTS